MPFPVPSSLLPAAIGLAFSIVAIIAVDEAQAASDRGNRAGPPRFVARLLPIDEVPALSSPGRGSFRASIDDAARLINYELRYDGLETTVLQAHVHVAQPGVITGQVSADQVVGPAAQGISPGEFEEVVRAIRNGVAYANVHTTQYPAGEIRGQVRRDWASPADAADAVGPGSGTSSGELDEVARTAWLRELRGRSM